MALYNPYMRWLPLFVFVAANLTAQQSSVGTISGAVTDPEGRAVRVPVQVVNAATKVAYRGMASAAGEYSIPQLPAGTYQLTVQALANSYRAFVRDDVRVAAGQTVKLDIHLEEGFALDTFRGASMRPTASSCGRSRPLSRTSSPGSTPRVSSQ